MKKENYIICLLLLCSCTIYTFYRPDSILINEIWINLGWTEERKIIGDWLDHNLPLPTWVIYNLPEALWTICLTICCKPLYLKRGKKKIRLVLLPPLFVIVLEFFQMLHITKGTFDLWDIALSVIAWVWIAFLPGRQPPSPFQFYPLTFLSYRLIFVWIIVLMAHFTG